MTTAAVVALASAVPAPPMPQSDVFDAFSEELYRELPQAEVVFAATQVRQRHLAYDPRKAFTDGFPPMSQRMREWERHVVAMGQQTLGEILAGVDRDRIGSYVMASCTGYAGPTPEITLAKQLGLRHDLRRTFIGHMGCYAAFNALKVGLDSLAGRPDELVLVTCAELCSLHLRPEPTMEQVVIHSLFGDAAASLLLSAAPDAAGPRLLRTHTETQYTTSGAMTWTVEDDSFRMTLSPYVPLILAETVRPFVKRLLEPVGLRRADIRHWGVHPGGPKIIELVGDRLGLADDQLRASREVLAEYGNCSSATILLILQQIMTAESPAPGDYGVFLAFGPGLTMESVLVRF